MSNQRKRRRKPGRASNRSQQSYRSENYALRDEIICIVLLFVMILLLLCNFGFCGKVGDLLSHVMFGLFGILAYIVPVLLAFATFFYISNAGSKNTDLVVMKIVAGVVLCLQFGIFTDLLMGRLNDASLATLAERYESSAAIRGGGGAIAGGIGAFLYRYLSDTGTILLVIVLGIICIVILTERSFIEGLRRGTMAVYSKAEADTAEYLSHRKERREQRQKREEGASRKRTSLPRAHKYAVGMTPDTDLKQAAEEETEQPDRLTEPVLPVLRQQADEINDIHEITIHGRFSTDEKEQAPTFISFEKDRENNRLATGNASVVSPQTEKKAREEDIKEEETKEEKEAVENDRSFTEEGSSLHESLSPRVEHRKPLAKPKAALEPTDQNRGEYIFPPITLLKAPNRNRGGDSRIHLKETAQRLEKILHTFGVNAKVTDVSQGPTVTRYELQPEIGVKVSKILNLSDDIKLNLAATDIRIEAPIPGKVAVGIEVPNKENITVTLRELLESQAYQTSTAALTFAVGKDIAGETIVTDLAKMPHLLIAGSTGSGKSVCINTMILSLLYKSRPEDVKLIMIDPKVVELNVYNSIPHLLIPVVTDPKKAAAALGWAVAEMTRRYKKFADAEVRDLSGYNKFVELHQGEEGYEKLPQIVLIVDELADLMMVSKNEVETAICRLAQLARAAGIHLIIATQRPSVDVITGLIKANMPSRIAFAVSSGTDSRTILDMNGAEKLLGKGDMLFFPQSYSKPIRVQGAFVSDKEIQDITDFLKKQETNSYQEDVQEAIATMEGIAGIGTAGMETNEEAPDRDEYFEDAGRFIIGKEKASIGNLQRIFKIGFNRAARIMDQLCEAGVVGEEEGTKPRKILMTMDQFEDYLLNGPAKESAS